MKHNVTGLLDQNRIERILTNLVNKLGSKDLPSILYSFFLGKQNQRGPKHSVSFSGGGGGGCRSLVHGKSVHQLKFFYLLDHPLFHHARDYPPLSPLNWD